MLYSLGEWSAVEPGGWWRFWPFDLYSKKQTVGSTWGKFVRGGRISEASVEVLLRINCVVDPKCKGILQMGEVGFWEGVVMVDFGLGFTSVFGGS